MSSMPTRIPPKDAAYLRTLANLKETESLPRAVEEVYAGLRRVFSKIAGNQEMPLIGLAIVGYIAGVGLEPPPPMTMLQLYETKQLKKDDLVEIQLRTKKVEKGKVDDAYTWVPARLAGYTPSKGFVVYTDPGGIRHEVKHTDCRLPVEPLPTEGV